MKQEKKSSDDRIHALALRWIARKLLLSRHFRRADLSREFHISDITANRWIQAAASKLPESDGISFGYDPSLKRYFPTASPTSDSAQASRLLEEAAAFSLLQGKGPLDGSFVDASPLFLAPDHPEWTFAISAAISSKAALRIAYASKNRAEEWTISPHRIIRTESRRHVRCYCHDLRRFIDIIPARILSCSDSKEPYIDSFSDREWHHEFSESFFSMNPALSPEETLAARLEWGWSHEDGDTLVVRSRVALSYYGRTSISRRGTMLKNGQFRPWFVFKETIACEERGDMIFWLPAIKAVYAR